MKFPDNYKRKTTWAKIGYEEPNFGKESKPLSLNFTEKAKDQLKETDIDFQDLYSKVILNNKGVKSWQENINENSNLLEQLIEKTIEIEQEKPELFTHIIYLTEAIFHYETCVRPEHFNSLDFQEAENLAEEIKPQEKPEEMNTEQESILQEEIIPETQEEIIPEIQEEILPETSAKTAVEATRELSISEHEEIETPSKYCKVKIINNNIYSKPKKETVEPIQQVKTYEFHIEPLSAKILAGGIILAIIIFHILDFVKRIKVTVE